MWASVRQNRQNMGFLVQISGGVKVGPAGAYLVPQLCPGSWANTMTLTINESIGSEQATNKWGWAPMMSPTVADPEVLWGHACPIHGRKIVLQLHCEICVNSDFYQVTDVVTDSVIMLAVRSASRTFVIAVQR